MKAGSVVKAKSPGAQFSVGYNVCVVRVCYPTAGSVVMGVPPPPGSVAWLGRTLVGAEAGVVAVGGPGAADHGPIVPALPAGGYMGEGMLPIPEKVVRKILELAFVEMGDLMPEVWMREEEEALVSRNVSKEADGTGNGRWAVGAMLRRFGQCTFHQIPTSGTGSNGIHGHHREMFPGLPRRGMGPVR